jgi:TolB-like protein
LSSSSSALAGAGPIAVMPFKNLAGGGDLDWLKLGIAETLIADLARDGGRPVVERDQIDRALAEVMLQDKLGSDDGTAARAGKLVGATTVVVGGFQQQEKASGSTYLIDIRITARFVNVETGVVEDTAKVTGSLEDVFSLQDQIVARLLKKATKVRAKAKKPQQTVEAYKIYSLSLSTSSEAERVRYLKEAIALDGDFVYALDDLKALERRLDRYRNTAARALDDKAQALVLLAKDTSKTPDERALAITQAFGAYTSGYRWRALRDLAAAIYALDDVPRSAMLDPRELSSFYFFLSLVMLKQGDLALQAGERHLKEFPAGSYSGSVDGQMRNLIDDRRRRVEQEQKARVDLHKLVEEEAILEPTAPNRADRVAMFGFRRCSTLYQGRIYEEAIKACRAWAKANPNLHQTAPNDPHLDELALYFAALSLSELGKFEDAREALQQLQSVDEAWARGQGIPSFLSTWPRE